ncbi:MAG: carboxypeptidase regulatory-like domain-containing protein, partial [Acidobacteria bacterium]|nr:carboxypeptidase regulatory-like domain-containing protein [Acidobacteriota bacterium]
MPSTSRLFVILVALIALGLPGRALAQFETAAVVGTVRDGSGAVVADARVTLTSLDTGVSSERVSDGAGNFEFFNVRIGRYVITADKAGFSVAVVDNVQVTVGARLRVDVSMAVGQITEKVEVRASAVQ